MKSSFISIIVPVYNVENYLSQCVDSLINQTLKDIEIILVDDGSTDGSGRMCDMFAEKDDRIVVIHQKNAGLSAARNTGIEAAKGDFVCFVDSDDWIDIHTCNVVYATAIEKNADLVFWLRVKEFPGYSKPEKSIFDADREFSDEALITLHRRMVGLLGPELSTPTRTDAINSAWGKLYRRTIITSNNLRFVSTKEIGSEDVLFNIQLMYYVKRAFFLQKYYSHYRQDNPNSLTRNHNSTLFPRFINLFSHIEKFIQEKKLGSDFEKALDNRVSVCMINVILTVLNKNNPSSQFEKYQDIKGVLQNDIYKKSIREFQLRHLPLHWRIFFFCCKYKLYIAAFIAAKIIRKLK